MKLRVIFTFLIILFSCPLLISGSKDSLTLSINENKPDEKEVGASSSGINIKLSPAIFWKTLGVEVEVPLGQSFSLNGTVFGKLGRTDGKSAKFKIQNESFLKNGMRAELGLKYYFKKEAPWGLYLQANVAYSQIVYFDGTTKPFSINDNRKGFADLNYRKPNPLSVGLAGGYHLLMIGEHISGDVMLGVQANMDADNKPFFSGYIFPAIGYVF